jgi:hypothetical protein
MSDTLTSKQAYAAMHVFLQTVYKHGGRDIGGLLGDMSLLNDGGPADPSIEKFWTEAVRAAKDPNVDIDLKLTR